MKRSRSWLRWLALGLAAEASLWLYGASRICFDVPGKLDRSRPILLQDLGGNVALIENGNKSTYFYSGATSLKSGQVLEVLFARGAVPRGARRTREGQLLDDHGRILLNQIEDNVKFAYSPKYDLLVWATKPGESRYGLNIRSEGVTRFVRTWSIDDVQIRPDGTIWLAEFRLQCGIATLNAEGKFLGWRAFGHHLRHVQRFLELNPADLAHVEAARKKHDEEEG